MPMPALRSMDTMPDQHGFQQGVANAIAAFPAEGIHKVVLSITSRLHFTEAVPVAALRTNLRRLNPSGYLFQVPLKRIHLHRKTTRYSGWISSKIRRFHLLLT